MSVVGIKDLKTLLGDKADKFSFQIVNVPDKGPHIKMKAKEFLPKPEFDEVYQKVKEYNGRYAPLGKESHMLIPTQAGTPQVQQASEDKQSSLQEIVDDFERLLTKLRKVAY